MLSVVATLEHRKTCHCRQMQGPARKSRATVDSSAAESTYMVKNYAPMVELVDTLVLEASAQASEFESRLGHQIMEAWQSPAYCNSLENCRVERHREFESHRFRQMNVSLV